MKKSQNSIADIQAKTLNWDAADYLEDVEDVVAYMEAAFEDGDSRVITAALGDIARSKGMTAVAGQAGMGRESLYKALSRDGNPGFSSVLKVLKAVGLRLRPLAVDQVPAMLEEDSRNRLERWLPASASRPLRCVRNFRSAFGQVRVEVSVATAWKPARSMR